MGAVGDAGLVAPAIAGRRRELLATSAGLLVLVFAIWAWLALVGPLPGDRAAAHWWVHWVPVRSLSPDLYRVLTFFDSLATPFVAAGTVLALVAMAAERLGRRWALLVGAAAGVVVLNALLKQLFGATPLWVELHNDGRNFPSGHVAYLTSLLGMLVVVALDRGRRVAAATCVVLIVLMGITRVVAESHLPSDVIAGYAVGGAWLCAVLAVGLPWALRDCAPDRLRP